MALGEGMAQAHLNCRSTSTCSSPSARRSSPAACAAVAARSSSGCC